MSRNSDFISKVILRLNTVKSVYLSIADMLYSAILVIADSFSWNQPNHGQTLIKNLLHSGPIVKMDTKFWHRVKGSNQIYQQTQQSGE